MTVLSLVADAPRLPGRVVVIDVFRSSNTIIELLARGASRVVAVGEVDKAQELKRTRPGMLLLGERKGVRLSGCDGDNSPTQDLGDIKGAEVALTTSGGTRCISACGPDRELWIGSFANAGTLIARLREAGSAEVGFWAVGVAGEQPAEEDELCAAYLDALWSGEAPDFGTILPELSASPGAARLRELGQFADLEYCCQLDTRTVTPLRPSGDTVGGFIL